jgi:hypothetical protein
MDNVQKPNDCDYVLSYLTSSSAQSPYKCFYLLIRLFIYL